MRPEALLHWLRSLNLEDCTCPYAYKSLGRLYGISMGKGWVRLSDSKDCLHHSKE